MQNIALWISWYALTLIVMIAYGEYQPRAAN